MDLQSLRKGLLIFCLAIFIAFGFVACHAQSQKPKNSFQAIEEGFRQPPQSAGVRCFWWWLNGNVTKKAITRDLEQMKAKGFSGAILVDAGGAEQQQSSGPGGADVCKPFMDAALCSCRH